MGWTTGELNYNITMALALYGPGLRAETIIDEFVTRYTQIKGLSYQTINDIMGVLVCAASEINRRIGKSHPFKADDNLIFLSDYMDKWYNLVAAPYEDKKIKANGDLEVFEGNCILEVADKKGLI
jgi:hypothetical protein